MPQPYDYTNMDRPYGSDGFRETSPLKGNMSPSSMGGAETPEGPSEVDDSTSPMPYGDKTQGPADIWVETWMKSRNYRPGETGFIIDGRASYADFARLLVGRRGVTIIQTETGVNSSNAIYIENSSNYAAIDIRKSVLGSGIYVQVESPAGYGVDVLQRSNTAGIHVVTTNPTSDFNQYRVPLQLENDAATSTNFYKIGSYLGPGGTPSIDVWIANNVSPHGSLSGGSGSVCHSTNGNMYICQGGLTWKTVTLV